MRCLAFLLPVLAVAAAAHGATTCLTGDATLGDQRALATLQGQIDATCPCPSFTGGPGHARKDYRSCAKPLVDAAVASSALRGDCKRTVLTDVRTSTCGTTLVACGRVQPSARTPVTCHVKAADRCHDRSNAQETACTAETRCGDVVTWTAGTCLDGRDPGPASPGAIHVTYTKPSVTNPAATRTLDTVIWYPTTVTGPLDPQTAAVLDAPVDPTGGPFPVLVFSHGLCGFPAQSTFLTALLATRRYLVIAPSHPGSTIYDCAGGTEDLVTSALERPSEATYVLDQLVAAGQDPGSPFYGLVDTTRLGMSGHSFGGQTAYKLSTDPRFRAVALLAPAVPLMNPPVVPIPSLAMFGDDDTFVPLQPIRDRFAAAAAPKFLVDIAHTGHFAFSNGCLGTQPDCAYPAEMSQPEAHAVVLRWVVPFLEVYLRGGSRLDALLTPPVPPGVTLQAVR